MAAATVSRSGIGYGAGAGAAVTQATSKSTGVTLTTAAAVITLNAANLASNTKVSFTITNALIAAADIPLICLASGNTAASYKVWVDAVAAGSCRITLHNDTGGALAEAVILNFALIKGAAS